LWWVLFVFTRNTSYLPANVLWMPSLAAVMIALILILLFLPIIRAPGRAAAAASMAILLLISIRPAYEGLIMLRLPFIVRYGERMILVFVLLLIFCLAARMRKMRAFHARVTEALNVASLAALLLVGTPILLRLREKPAVVNPVTIVSSGEKIRATGRPNIYHIVLDSYPGSEILQKYYHHDNTAFLEALRELGFFVAKDARTNYIQSMLSLGSTLNVSYLDEVLTDVRRDSWNRRPLKELLEQNAVRRFLAPLGYRFVAFGTGYEGTELRAAEEYLSSRPAFSEFENMLFVWTPIATLVGLIKPGWQHRVHRERILFTFDRLERLARAPGPPRFVFAHLVTPHPPYVFDRKGKERRDPGPYGLADGCVYIDRSSLSQYRSGFAEQVAFVEQRTLAMVRTILRDSAVPPVIVLQSDHGPRSIPDQDEALRILNALWLPGEQEGLRAGMSPVNNFRMVLSHLFGARLPLLPDRHFLSKWERPYAFEEVCLESEE
jgi:hypothetical protein